MRINFPSNDYSYFVIIKENTIKHKLSIFSSEKICRAIIMIIYY